MLYVSTLTPHDFQPQMRALARGLRGNGSRYKRPPTVFFRRLALKKMQVLLELATVTEVGWCGTVVELDDGDLLVEDLFLTQQLVCEEIAMVSYTTDGYSELYMALARQGERGLDTINALRGWFHSHVRMATTASSVDEGMIQAILKTSDHPWHLRGILNQLGRMELTLFDKANGVRIVDVPWALYRPAEQRLRKALAGEYRQKVQVLSASEFRRRVPTPVFALDAIDDGYYEEPGWSRPARYVPAAAAPRPDVAVGEAVPVATALPAAAPLGMSTATPQPSTDGKPSERKFVRTTLRRLLSPLVWLFGFLRSRFKRTKQDPGPQPGPQPVGVKDDKPDQPAPTP